MLSSSSQHSASRPALRAPAPAAAKASCRSSAKCAISPGETAGYAVFNLGANYSLTQKWQLGAQINNLFDTRYNTAAQLGANGFDTNGNFAARALGGSNATGFPVPQSTFYAPGAPRMVSVSLRYVFY